MTTLGPFGTSADAFAAAVLAAGPADEPIRAGMIPAGNRELLARVLGDAGVMLGQFDERIVEWLSQWEPSTVVVIAGWVSRAYEAGKAEALRGEDEQGRAPRVAEPRPSLRAAKRKGEGEG